MIPNRLRSRLDAANRESRNQWRKVQGREDWQRFRDEKIRLLREAIGPFPQEVCDLRLQVVSTVEGEGCRIQNLVFQSRPGLWVSANLYVPAKPGESMPGLLICHAHHTPKEHGELQDMGVMWARAGCLVLVPDMLGHGERRQHPFRTPADYDKPFRVGRQDYYFRYDLGMQLHLAGETLMGWFAWDLRRCVDVLLSQRDVDSKRIIILGAVAGGGDPAAVAAALDKRITATVVYNSGGAEPESPYPLPEDAEAVFNFAGSGSFESTRNLRRSATDGFLPWVIVGAIAPRRLIYAHEFAWDRPRDPVWKRLETIWEFYDARGRLSGIHGRGSVKGGRPESTHCTHIGPIHRESIHPILASWFDISVTEDDEITERLGERSPTCTEAKLPPERATGVASRHWDLDTLRCMTPELARQLKPKRLCDLLPQRAAERISDVRNRRAAISPDARRERSRRDWASVLGSVTPPSAVKVLSVAKDDGLIEGIRVDRVRLEVEPGIVVPLVLLRPRGAGIESDGLPDKPSPVVVAVAHAGKDKFLQDRAGTIAELLAGGAAVCLPDLRGLGETKPAGSRERWGSLTAQASTALMLGDPMVAARLRDLRSVLAYLRGRSDLNATRIALWGDSFAATNPPERNFHVPRHMDDRPRWSEPLGGLLALLGALYEDKVCAVYVRGGLSDFASVVSEPFVYIPPDVVIPGVLTVGDVPDLAATLAPRPLRMDGLVDGFNRLRTAAEVWDIYRPTRQEYNRAGAADRLFLHDTTTSPAKWLLRQLAVN
ncbi:MAG: acetylxylan esterase [Planctomycetes bacterium]|nr:acetylxylan esterase [Planctomycetota bacterium]